jgi:uncharacterized Fe-S cluster-containing protein
MELGPLRPAAEGKGLDMAEILKMLPGYNCGECGHRQCKDYAEEISRKGDFSKCPHLELDRFIDPKAEIQQFSVDPHCC